MFHRVSIASTSYNSKSESCLKPLLNNLLKQLRKHFSDHAALSVTESVFQLCDTVSTQWHLPKTSVLSHLQCFPAENEAVLRLTQYRSPRPFSQSFSQRGHWTVSEFDRKISCSSTFLPKQFVLWIYFSSLQWQLLFLLFKCFDYLTLLTLSF